jgi:hypothetical protein
MKTLCPLRNDNQQIKEDMLVIGNNILEKVFLEMTIVKAIPMQFIDGGNTTFSSANLLHASCNYLFQDCLCWIVLGTLKTGE